MSAEFKDKTVLLVDDGIVRGNTGLEICLMAREAGAKSIIFASASPPVQHSHIYGSMPLFRTRVQLEVVMLKFYSA